MPKVTRAYVIALKRYLNKKTSQYTTVRPLRPRPPPRPFRWRPRPMAVDIPPLNVRMDIDQPHKLDVVECPSAWGAIECMDISPPSPTSSLRVPLASPPPLSLSSRSKPLNRLRKIVLPSSRFGRGRKALSSSFASKLETFVSVFHGLLSVLPPGGEGNAACWLRFAARYPTIPFPASSAPSSRSSVVAASRAVTNTMTAWQHCASASPSSRESTPPKASRDGTISPMEYGANLSPLNGPVLVLVDDDEDVSNPKAKVKGRKKDLH